MLKYFIFEGYKLIIESITGKIDLNDYFDLKKSEIADPKFNPDFNIIVDLRKVDFVFDSKTELLIKQYVDLAKSTPNFLTKRKGAFITDNPDQVIVSILYKSLDKVTSHLEIFSTFDAALKWLGIENFDTMLYYQEK